MLFPRLCSRWSRKAATRSAFDIIDVQLAGLFVRASGGEHEQQAPGVAVSTDGVVAGVALPTQPFGEERLQGGGQGAHRGSPPSSRRSTAAPSSSGAADRYQ